MRSCRLLLAFGSVVLAIGCATLQVDYDYDPAVDFSTLRTFDWLPNPDSAVQALTVKRIQNAVTAQLQTKGLRLTSDHPDFLIGIRVSERTSNAGAVGVGASMGLPIGGGLFSLGTGHSTPTRKREGTLVLDFVSSDSSPLWHSSATETVDSGAPPEEQAKRINRAVAKMLAQFPPHPKK